MYINNVGTTLLAPWFLSETIASWILLFEFCYLTDSDDAFSRISSFRVNLDENDNAQDLTKKVSGRNENDEMDYDKSKSDEKDGTADDL
eukprot:CAMPEP_0176340474 /NCGR_PEP_ID=MMETSP0126-20121128/1593_1 /TAXON_ID=141414 ORGANISM="Strombidinopsis acuminatum, Strain SPMC142" /NCGR_SAMPLE_ID=MMETSP0126 /ASSEMBLY_ACC=CAM_ASM_000229 /LENGTH=88 /DNA_ID=CAMNT_0017684685 /DNA_START=669 /DNA_END=935 /DNA_ORIENTATION=+